MSEQIPLLVRYRTAIAFGSIVLLALVTRAWNVASVPLWTDELYSVSFARTPLTTLWSDWAIREPNPPLYYSLLSGWIHLVGETELGVRSMSILFGLAGLTAVFLIGRSLHSTGAGLVAALLAAVSSHQLQYSQEARAYMLAFAGAGFALFALIRLSDSWRRGSFGVRATWPWLASYIAATSIAVYAHTTLVLLPVLANVYIGCLWATRAGWARASVGGWLSANAIIGMLCAWWFWITYQQVTSGMSAISWIENVTLTEAISRTTHIVGTRSIDGLNLPIAILVGGLMSFGVSRFTFEKRTFAVVFGLGIPVAMFLLSLARPVFIERALLWAQAIYLPCLAAGIMSVPLAGLRYGACAIFVALWSYDAINWSEGAYREPWHTVASELHRRTEPEDAILVYDADVPENLRFYEKTYGAPRATIFALEAPPGKVMFAERFDGETLKSSELAHRLGRYDRIFVLQRGTNDDFDEDPTDQVALFASQLGGNLLGPDQGRNNELRLTIWRIPER